MKLRCTKVMITGGGSGIGKAIAKRFVQDGANVVIAGRSKEKLKNVCDEINSKNINYIEWDIAKLSQSEINFEKASSLMGGFDGLVNCVAIGTGALTGRGYEPWDITEEEWDKLTDVNFKAAFFMMRNTVDYFIKNKTKAKTQSYSTNFPFTITLFLASVVHVTIVIVASFVGFKASVSSGVTSYISVTS